MSAELNSITPKQLFALLTGAIQLKYLNDTSITIELLKEHIFPTEDQISIEIIEKMIFYLEEMLKNLFFIKASPEPTDINNILQKYNITDTAVIATWVKVLKDKAPLITAKIIEQNKFANGVNIQWRIDTINQNNDDKSDDKHTKIDNKTAFVKFNKQLPDGTETEVVLELNKAQIDAIAEQCRNIQAKLDTLG
jgi:hypothetical protein